MREQKLYQHSSRLPFLTLLGEATPRGKREATACNTKTSSKTAMASRGRQACISYCSMKLGPRSSRLQDGVRETQPYFEGVDSKNFVHHSISMTSTELVIGTKLCTTFDIDQKNSGGTAHAEPDWKCLTTMTMTHAIVHSRKSRTLYFRTSNFRICIFDNTQEFHELK